MHISGSQPPQSWLLPSLHLHLRTHHSLLRQTLPDNLATWAHSYSWIGSSLLIEHLTPPTRNQNARLYNIQLLDRNLPH
ncbi:hypothetical protein DBV05_g11929 [Lasiodiplodia theobromae]|uniref:Uncharacterized protein n=1 Tax=Lasiodiplodia theobromae TaxID=45133 RepID=A0A5N5CVL9_9PEZI|nr:hypothetical protein DBV05_g11929 [Lasiodiplodia theobromae]